VSALITIAEAVVTRLNAGDYSQEFTAERKYVPKYDLKDVKTLQVAVVPRSQAIARASRTEDYFDCAAHVGVMKKVDPDDLDEVDALCLLVQEILDELRGKPITDPIQAAWLSIANEPAWDPEHMDQLRQFTSVITVNYRLRR